jgi:hypothetical protein
VQKGNNMSPSHKKQCQVEGYKKEYYVKGMTSCPSTLFAKALSAITCHKAQSNITQNNL